MWNNIVKKERKEMKAYSEDLRKRVIESHKEGKEKGAIIKIFKIGISTLNRWIREYEASGSYGPKERTSYRKRKLNDEELIKYVEETPSATLEQMAKHFKVKIASVWQRLKQVKITRKKKSLVYEGRDEEQRKEFVEELEKKKDGPIIFIDECGIKNNLKNEYGSSPCGIAVVDEVKGD
jgi:transposase